MSNEALVVLDNPGQALAQGGLGLGAFSRLLEVKPSTMEIVQKTSRQENVEIGKFRDTSTNIHFDEIQVVLLAMPIEQRQLYRKGNEFSKDAKLCFSLDNLVPHARAKNPQAPFCKTCPMGDIGWAQWRQTKDPNDVPQCKKYWHLFLADRKTQMPYYFNAKGTSVQQFEYDMQKLGRLLLQLEANAKATPENKQIAIDNRAIMEANAKLAEGETTTPLKPFVGMPNIFDITFTMYLTQKDKGGPFVVMCKDFKQLNAEGKQEFGELYMDFLRRKNEGLVQDQLSAEAEAESKVATQPAVEAPRAAEVAAIIGEQPKPLAVEGQIVDKKEPITI